MGIIFSDIVAERKGIWKQVEQVQDPELRALAEQLPSVFKESLAHSSSKNYCYGFLRWKKWAGNYEEVSVLPAKPFYVALYLLRVLQDARSASVVDLAAYSINWAHRMAGIQSPTSEQCVKVVLECAKRRLSGKKVKKDVITAEMIEKCLEISDLEKLADLRLITMCILAYAGFLRFDELQHLKRCDIQFCGHFLKLFIESSKTDQYRDGAWIVIARSDGFACPYRITQKYCESIQMPQESNEFLFRSITTKKDGSQCLRTDQKPISYTRARELFLQLFNKAGYKDCNLGLHGLRAGGASAAANGGIPDRLFKRHGRWKSESAKDGYIRDDLGALLSVSKCLGI